MKTRSLFFWCLGLGLILAANTVRAVDPEPYTLPVSYSYKIGYAGNAILQFNDGSAPWLYHAYADGPESGTGVGRMKPGKQYTIGFLASGVSDYWISLVAPSGYQFYVSTVEREVGVPKDHIRVTGKSGEYGDSYYVQIRPVVAEKIIPAGSFSGIDIGQAVSFEIGLGATRSGISAGLVKFREIDFTNSPSDRARLVFVPPAMGDQWNLIPSGPSDWTVRQVVSPRNMIDFVDDGTGGYYIHYYNYDDTIYDDDQWPPIYLIKEDSGVPRTPWRSIHVQSASGQLTITEKENQVGAVERVSQLTLTSGTVASGTYVWTLLEGGASNAWLRKTTHTSTKTGTVRENLVRVYTMSGTTEVALVSETKYIYHTDYAWGEDLYQVVVNPNGGSSAVTTTYDYYTTAPSYGSETYRGTFRRVKSVLSSDGSWTAYDYYDDWNRRGQLKYQYEPYVDGPTSVTFSSSLTRMKTFDYAEDTTGRYRWPASVIETANGTTTAKTTWAYTASSDTPKRIKATVKNYFGSGGSDYLQTYTESIDPASGDLDQSGAPYVVKNPDGTQTSWSRSRGDYSNPGFTVPGTYKQFWRILKVQGAAVAGSGTGNEPEATSQSSYDGQSFAPIYLAPNKSTMEVTILDYSGIPLRTEMRVYTGSGNWSSAIGSKTSAIDHTRTNRLTSTTAADGTSTTYTYDTSGRLGSITGGDAIQVDYTYDNLGRTATMKKVGVSASGDHAAQEHLTTTYAYDGADRVKTTTVSGSNTSETIVSTKAYDLAGRVTSTTPPGLSATTYSYSTAARTVTTTAPDGGTTIQETYLDGRLKSVTGTATVPVYYTYSRETDGRQVTQANSGASNSSRLRKSWVDWLGREIKTEKPGFSQSSQSASIEERFFDGTTGQLIKITATGYAPTRYTYNALGQVLRSGLDVNDNGLVVASMDRITEVDTSFESYSSAWWLKTTTTTYPDDNANTHPITSSTRQRLTGISTSLLGETQSTDAEGNTVTTTSSISGKIVTTRTAVPGITAADAYAYSYNGLASVTIGHDGLKTKLAYDKLGRLATQTDARGNATTTAYYTGTTLVYTVQDAVTPTPNTVSTIGYDTSGRTSWTSDAQANVTYNAYNQRGQLIRQWGGGTYPVEYEYDATYGDKRKMRTWRTAPGGLDFTHATAFAPANHTYPASTGDVTEWVYDEPTGLLWKKLDAAAKAVVMDYNVRGQVARRTLARGVYTNYAYSSTTGELTGLTYSDSTPTVSYAYTRTGQTETVTDGATGSWDYVYDPAKPWRLSAIGLPSFYGTRTQTLLYESSGAIGRYKGFQVGLSAGGTQDFEQNYTYSTDGRFDTLVSKRDSNSVTRTFDYAYVSNTPFVSGFTASGVSNYSVALAYDAKRNLLETVDTQWSGASLVRYDYVYDSRYQRQSAKLSGSAYSDYYVASGSPTYSSVFNYYNYNSRGELQTAAMYRGAPSGSAPSSTDELPGRRFEYRYDALGNRQTAGPTGNNNDVDEVYTTNALNQYTKKENNTVRVLGTVGSVTAKVAVRGAPAAGKKDHAWGADLVPANELTALLGTAQAYAATAGGGGGGGDLVRLGTASYFVPKWEQAFAYDDDGNLTHDSVWDYTYDAENRLIAMQHRAEVIGTNMIASANARKLTFVYDYLGRRVRKTVYGGWNGSAYSGTALTGQDTKFLYDGWNLLAEYTVSGSTLTLLRSYTWGLDITGGLTAAGGVGALLQVYDAGVSKTLLPAYDGNGNVMAMVNASSGALEAIYEYDPFGNPLRKEGSYAGINPIRFSSKYTDAETDLVYYGFRYYSANLGRFINRDPIAESGGLNLYGFVGNNAVNRWDYLGMDEFLSWDTPNGSWFISSAPTGMDMVDAKNAAMANVSFETYANQAMADALTNVVAYELASQTQVLGVNANGDYIVATYSAEATNALAEITSSYTEATGKVAMVASMPTSGMTVAQVNNLVYGKSSASNGTSTSDQVGYAGSPCGVVAVNTFEKHFGMKISKEAKVLSYSSSSDGGMLPKEVAAALAASGLKMTNNPVANAAAFDVLAKQGEALLFFRYLPNSQNPLAPIGHWVAALPQNKDTGSYKLYNYDGTGRNKIETPAQMMSASGSGPDHLPSGQTTQVWVVKK